MQKWIQRAENPWSTQIITQNCGSNNFSPDFEQRSPKNIVEKESFRKTLSLRQYKRKKCQTQRNTKDIGALKHKILYKRDHNMTLHKMKALSFKKGL